MHDPMVVAHEIPFPLPQRVSWRERSGRRWGFDVSRRTNPENLGERTYPWWRPKGYTLRLAGRAYGLGSLATIWHVEPGGRDALTVCSVWKDGKRTTRWKWHVHHWHLQVHALQSVRARLFDRCAECGRKGRPNFSHQWDGPGIGWRKWRSRPGLYHYECSSLVHLRRQGDRDETLIRHLVAALRVERDEDEATTLAWLTDTKQRGLEFPESYRLTKLLGYDRDDSYRLVKREARA